MLPCRLPAPVQVTVIEANELLGSFDARLREYAARKLVRAGVRLMRGIVKEVREKELELKVSSTLLQDVVSYFAVRHASLVQFEAGAVGAACFSSW